MDNRLSEKSFVRFWKINGLGLLLCVAIAVFSWILGKKFPIIGGAVIAILMGMVIGACIKDKTIWEAGIKFTSKKILQWAVILLGFGMNLNVIIQTGKQSLPIIVCTITTSLVIAYLMHRVMKIPSNIAILVGVGSSICGGSAIAATAPVINADDEDVAQAISVIFFFNVIAAILFPILGNILGFNSSNGEAFGIFAGTAINDTSSVTAAASTWDSMYALGSETLDKAVTVKLTRTLAIIPITLFLATIRMHKEKKNNTGTKVSIRQIFPFFIIYFVIASLITTVAISQGLSQEIFAPVKELSKFFIVMAMAAIGFNSNVVSLAKSGGKPMAIGLCCWIGITAVSLLMQSILGIW